MLIQNRCCVPDTEFHFVTACQYTCTKEMLYTRIFRSLNTCQFIMFKMVCKFRWTICLSLGSILIIYTYISYVRHWDNVDTRPNQGASTTIQNSERAFAPYYYGEYSVISNLLTPAGETKAVVNQADITVCSQTSLGNLFQIEALATAWSGPISLTVFTYDDRVDVTLGYILLLRRCSPEVRQRTSFHLMAPVGRAPETLNLKVEQTTDCGLLEEWKKKFAEDNYALKGVQYPVNVLRAVALTNARTPYVTNLDIDLLPSYGMHEDLLSYFSKLSETEKIKKTLYVLPSFESKSSNGIMSKKELIEANKQGTVRPFSAIRCKSCQAKTNYKQWFSLPFPSEMGVAYSTNYHFPYEPYYVAQKKTLPSYDGRFKQYGFNRMSQVCEAYVSGFDLAVLNNAFVTHDGFRTHASKAKNDSNKANVKLFKNVFIPELKGKYPESARTC